MTKKEIEILAKESYTKDSLDEKKVFKFSSYMDRKNLKAYIRELKKIEQNHNVVIALVSQTSYNNAKDTLQQIFKDKHILFQEDPSLLAGIRIVNNDMIYEKSLQRSFETMIQTIENRYE